eukprot:gb/GEZN01020556.1/.p1 GENE.gb/GEZN01020556.1/~~gb/GEZN01020556.1/.p1  ORF type:complete len:208 (+),score=41.25 gb/GEZN01020556.1/:28-651(+)
MPPKTKPKEKEGTEEGRDPQENDAKNDQILDPEEKAKHEAEAKAKLEAEAKAEREAKDERKRLKKLYFDAMEEPPEPVIAKKQGSPGKQSSEVYFFYIELVDGDPRGRVFSKIPDTAMIREAQEKKLIIKMARKVTFSRTNELGNWIVKSMGSYFYFIQYPNIGSYLSAPPQFIVEAELIKVQGSSRSRGVDTSRAPAPNSGNLIKD